MQLELETNQIPYWSNWMGVWAMHEPAFNALWRQVQQVNIAEHLAAVDPQLIAASDNFEMSVIDGIAILNLSGPMMKHRSSVGGSISTVEARRAVMTADRDASIRGMVIKLETPGGTVAGTMEFAKAIADFSKPTLGFANDLCASAGYWAISQCDTVHANVMAMVGGIGTFAKIEDSSKAAADAGIVVHVIRAGEFKGAGAAGTEIEEKHIADAQRLIGQINSHFLATIAEGRSMEPNRVSELADGRVHIATDAKSMGLIDAVSTFESAFSGFQESLSQSSTGDVAMTTDTTSQPITAAELEEKFPKSNAEWRFNCLKHAWTESKCVQSHAEIQETRAEAAEEALRQAEAAATKPGVDASTTCGTDASIEGDAASAWQEALSASMKACNGNRQRALSLANKNNPGLREAMVQQYNAIHRRR